MGSGEGGESLPTVKITYRRGLSSPGDYHLRRSVTAAGTIPGVGLSSLFALKKTGAPWSKSNLTVVVTSGAGGTGFVGIQLAKAYGAAHVVTATSSDNIAFVKSLGADTVVD